MDKEKKIKIAQIGINTNSHSNDIFATLEKQSEIYEIAGYVFPENERKRLPQRAAGLEGYRELTLDEIWNDPEIEAVTIETDEIYLTKYALAAAKAGKHIHMEKPGGVGASDFQELIEVMKQTKKTLHFGYMYRYNPYVRELLGQIRDGELGPIISVEAQMNCLHAASVRQWLKNFPGGMMFFLGCHLVDLIFSIQGKPKRILPFNKCSGVDGVTAEDFGMAVFEYENGVSFAKTSAVEMGGFARRQLVVSGTKKTVELNPMEWYLPDFSGFQTQRVVRDAAFWHENYQKQWSEPFDRYEEMMRMFAEMVRGKRENPYTLDHELELYKMILCACGREDVLKTEFPDPGEASE